VSAAPVNRWVEPAWAQRYLEERLNFPWRETAYGELLGALPSSPRRFLDLGCGDGEVTARIREAAPESTAVAADFSAEMLGRARLRFADDPNVEVVEHDLDASLPRSWGTFDAVVSAFAIHHVVDERKRALYAEVYERLVPGGVFLNLEHVTSATAELHVAFLATIGKTLAEDDPSNKLAPVETQLGWLRGIGFDQVDCHYKWREIALLAGQKPR
jgi:tRNA (cmo5U34)-methyltransferase